MAVDCVEFCKAMADDTRQKILLLLMDGDKCVSEIAEAFDLSQPTVSHHLSILKQYRLVTSHRKGKLVIYHLNRENLVECCGLLMAKFDVQSVCEG